MKDMKNSYEYVYEKSINNENFVETYFEAFQILSFYKLIKFLIILFNIKKFLFSK